MEERARVVLENGKEVDCVEFCIAEWSLVGGNRASGSQNQRQTVEQTHIFYQFCKG